MKDKLLQIAEAVLHMETLETQNSDELDFHDLSVWAITEALRVAFEAGREHERGLLQNNADSII